ncbi:MAG: hypothetical protein V9G22_15835 [Ottowia sp.]
MLLRLVRPAEGLEFTRARARREELHHLGDRGRVQRVLDKLVAADLVRIGKGATLDDDRIDIGHEALLRNWPRLVVWLEEERARLRTRLRLTSTAEAWAARGKGDEALLRGVLLEEALAYDDLSEQERAFVAASRGAMETERSATEERQKRELAKARSQARWRAMFAAVTGVLTGRADNREHPFGEGTD